jgi:hypothetical protein
MVMEWRGGTKCKPQYWENAERFYLHLSTPEEKAVSRICTSKTSIQFNSIQQTFYLFSLYWIHTCLNQARQLTTWTFFNRHHNHLVYFLLRLLLPTPLPGWSRAEGGDSSCRPPLLTDRHPKPRPPPPLTVGVMSPRYRSYTIFDTNDLFRFGSIPGLSTHTVTTYSKFYFTYIDTVISNSLPFSHFSVSYHNCSYLSLAYYRYH